MLLTPNPPAAAITDILGTWRKSYPVLLLGTIAVVVAADFLLYGSHRLGWSAALVAAAMLALLAVRDTRFLAHTGGRIAWAAAAGLLLALFEQPTWLNILYILVCFAVLAIVNTHGWDSDFVRWLRRLARWLFTAWTRLFLDNGVVMRWLVRRGFSPTLARGLAAWIIPVLFTSVFVAIFAWANPVISGWFAQLGTLIGTVIDKLPELFNFPRVMFWLGFATFAWSLMRSRTSRSRQRTAGMSEAEFDEWIAAARATREHNTLGIPASMVIRCLILFNVVFAIENVLDTRILWATTLPPGFHYTEYVHRGAYPLIAAALLAGAFVLVTFNPHSATERSPWARRLVYLWIAQTIFLTGSAAWRLVRYVEMSQLTRLRVASTIWFILVALGLLLIIWRIVRGRSNAWLININAIATLLILYPCCFINFDGLIASYNIRHCAEAGGSGSPLDIDYLQHLGTPALPALDSVRDKLTAPARHSLAENVSAELHNQLDADLADWRSWTWRRERTRQQADDVRIAKSRARWQLAQARSTARAAESTEGVSDVSR